MTSTSQAFEEFCAFCAVPLQAVFLVRFLHFSLGFAVQIGRDFRIAT